MKYHYRSTWCRKQPVCRSTEQSPGPSEGNGLIAMRRYPKWYGRQLSCFPMKSKAINVP